MKQELVFTVNGPGELNGWLLPLAKAFRQKYPQLLCTLYTVPCQFSAGAEAEQAAASGLFDHVFTVKTYKKHILRKNWPDGYTPADNGLVFYCGGDSLHAALLAKKYKYPLYGYAEGKLPRQRLFRKIFFRDLDGDLMLDAAAERDIAYQAVPIGSGDLTVGLYPGSRAGHLRLMLDFFSETAVNLKQKYPLLNFRWGINAELKELVEKEFPDRFAAPYEQPGERYDLIVSLTGTNTAISAARGIPLLVLLPFNKPALIPFTGLGGLLSDLPVLGRPFKRLLLKLSGSRLKFVAIPNLKAGRKIVPELIGFLTPRQVAQEVEKILLNVDERQRMHQELSIFMGKPGAQNIVNYFEEILA